MTLSDQFQAASALSPKAARLAVRMLEGGAGIPFDWRFSLSIALNERAQSSSELTTSDLMTLSHDRQDRDAVPFKGSNLEQVEARSFMRNVRDAIAGGPELGDQAGQAPAARCR